METQTYIAGRKLKRTVVTIPLSAFIVQRLCIYAHVNCFISAENKSDISFERI